MKYNFICLIILSLVLSCEKSEVIDVLLEEKEHSEILAALINAYEKNSADSLKLILDSWSRENQSKSSVSLIDDTHRDVYKIYQEFYTPLDLSRIGDSEWGPGIYQDVGYVIIQNHIFFDYNYDAEVYNVEETDTIWDFRPEITFDNVKTLYLTDNYAIAINEFLGTEFNPLGTGGVMNPASPTEESWVRWQFLNQFIYIVPGHWGGYWHIETHPEAHVIHFNPQRTKARLHFRLIYQGGEAEFQKSGNTWQMVSSKLTWIE